MKKLMIAAAATAMVGLAQAAVPVPAPCLNESGCAPAVFKLTASGKLSMDMGGYKSVQALKVKKGLLVAKLAAADDVCVDVTKNGWYAYWTAFSTSQYDTAPISASVTNGLKDVTLDFAYPTFKVEKLEKKFENLTDTEKAFVGQTAEITVNVYTGGVKFAQTKTTCTCKQYAGGFPCSYNSQSWTVQSCTPSAACGDCYDLVDIYVNVKAGKKSLALKYQDCELLKWSVFGKQYEAFKAVAGDGVTKYAYALEDEMAVKAEDYAGSEIIDAASLYMVGFGKAKLKQFAATKSALCRNGICTPETSAAFSLDGWFVGWYDTGVQAEESIYACDTCAGYLYGGTWSATYSEDLSIEAFDDADAESYIGASLDDIIE